MNTDTTILTENPSSYNPTTSRTHIGFDHLRALAVAGGLSVARAIGPGEALIPSRTVLGLDHYVHLFSASEAFCTCPNGGVGCWHVDRARQLTGPARRVVAPAPRVVREVQPFVAVATLPLGAYCVDSAGTPYRVAERNTRSVRLQYRDGSTRYADGHFLVRETAAPARAPWLPTATTQARATAALDDLFETRPRKVA